MAQPATTSAAMQTRERGAIVCPLRARDASHGDLRHSDNVSLDAPWRAPLCPGCRLRKSTLAWLTVKPQTLAIGREGLYGPSHFEFYRRARRKPGLVFQSPEDQIVTSVTRKTWPLGLEEPGPERAERPSTVLPRAAQRCHGALAQADLARPPAASVSVTIAAQRRGACALVLDEPVRSTCARRARS